MSDNNELGILARRKIEAEIIKPIYEILVREIGKARAQAVIGEAIEQAAIDAGKGFASKEPNGANIKSFIALQYLWEKDNALEVKVIDADDQQYNYNVTRCRYAEMYQPDRQSHLNRHPAGKVYRAPPTRQTPRRGLHPPWPPRCSRRPVRQFRSRHWLSRR